MNPGGNTISLITRAEPLTLAATPEHDDETKWALCDAYHSLRSQIERYASGKILGQSVLLAGHRGSGKTTLLHLAVQQVRWLAEGRVYPSEFQVNIQLGGAWKAPEVIKLQGSTIFESTTAASPTFTLSSFDNGYRCVTITGLHPLPMPDRVDLWRTGTCQDDTVFGNRSNSSARWRARLEGELAVVPDVQDAGIDSCRLAVHVEVDWNGSVSANLRIPTALLNSRQDAHVVIHGTLRVQIRRQFAAIPVLIPLHGPDLFLGAEDPASDDGRRLAEEAMSQIRRAAHRALSEEIGKRCCDAASATQNVRMIEAATQLRIELDQAPDLALLRMHWERAGLMPHGVLESFRREAGQVTRSSGSKTRSQGLKELLALQTAVEAIRPVERPSNQQESIASANRGPETKDRRESAVERGEASEPFANLEVLSPRYMSPNRLQEFVRLAAPILSLLAGAFAAHAVIEVLGPATAGAIAVITVLLSYSFLRQTLPNHPGPTLTGDPSVASQDLLLPVLVDRAMDAGFAPIFVVDELDKIGNLEYKLNALMKRLKYFVTDRAFFCFVADRAYYETFHTRTKTQPYAIQDTYFADRFLVYHSHQKLHEYLRKEVLKHHDSGIATEMSVELLRYLILSQSNAHIGELSRVLKEFSEGDRIRIPEDTRVLWAVAAYRLAILVQVAIECVCSDPLVASRLRQEPHFTQWLHDALYYFVREWRNDVRAIRYSRGEKIQSAEAEQIFDILERRISPSNDPAYGTSPTVALHSLDERSRDFLFKQMLRLVDFLENPHLLAFNLLTQGGSASSSQWPPSVIALVVQAVPALMTDPGGEIRGFHWIFNQYGQPIPNEKMDPGIPELWVDGVVQDNAKSIFSARFHSLDELGEFVVGRLGIREGLGAILGILQELPRSPATRDFWKILGDSYGGSLKWSEVVSLEGFEHLADSFADGSSRARLSRWIAFECLIYAEWSPLFSLLAVAAFRRISDPSPGMDLSAIQKELRHSQLSQTDWTLRELGCKTQERREKAMNTLRLYGHRFTLAALEALGDLADKATSS